MNSHQQSTFPVIADPATAPSALLRGLTMREAINRGAYYHVTVPGWASGGCDRVANSPAEAALSVGCDHAAEGFARGVELHAEVFRHLPSSRIGAAYLESCGVFQTLTADHYAI